MIRNAGKYGLYCDEELYLPLIFLLQGVMHSWLLDAGCLFRSPYSYVVFITVYNSTGTFLLYNLFFSFRIVPLGVVDVVDNFSKFEMDHVRISRHNLFNVNYWFINTIYGLEESRNYVLPNALTN